MKYPSASVGFFALSIISLSLLWLILRQHPSSVGSALCLSLFFSILVPVIIMAVRHEIWVSRLRGGELLRKTFKPGSDIDFHFEFMRSKYFCSWPDDHAANPERIYFPWRLPTPGGWLLLISSVPFLLLTASMTFILFLPSQQLSQLLEGSLGANILSVGGSGEAGPKDYENAITIASVAFAGAFLYCLRVFLRALLAFDLSAVTLLRAFVHALFAIMLAVVIWRVLPDAGGVDRAVAQSSMTFERKAPSKENYGVADAAASTAPLSKVVLFLTFAVGFLPDAGFAWMARKARLIVSRRSASFARRTAETPLAAIDGIDFMTAYRLQERNIANVQRLATANPIMLQVEMAAGIFTIMDWVAQAQLCAAVGPERFLLLRRLNLRTIVDLERAVLDPAAPSGLKQMVGAVLLASDGKTSILRDYGIRPLDVTFDKSLTAWVNVEVIEHVVLLITQDLHVKRFRQIWRNIESAMDGVKPDEAHRPPMKVAASQTVTSMPTQAKGYGHDDRLPAQVPFGMQAMPEPE